MSEARAGQPTTFQVSLGFLAVYVIWGSTYLAIRFAVETLPPFLMGGGRFLVAGAVLYAVLRARGAALPTRVHWRSATIVGALLLLGGNGLVNWAEQWVPSGTTALIVATVPLFMVLHGWSWGGDPRPGPREIIGLTIGFVGVGLLVGPGWQASGPEALWGAGALVAASFLWSGGSIYSRRAELPRSPLMATAMEMLAGGALLVLVGTLVGEWGALDVAAITWRSAAAWAYLIVFGSWVGFTAYIWILQVSTPAKVGTYAYVNPVIAVLLGWALAGESLTATTLVAAAVILASVILITTRRVPAAGDGDPAATPAPGATGRDPAGDDPEETPTEATTS